MNRWVIFLAVVLVPFVVGYYWLTAGPKNSQTVGEGDIRSFLAVTGELSAEDKAEMVFKTTGRVASVLVKEGDMVKKGQALARLDTRELNLSLARAQDDLRAAEAVLARVYDEVKDHDDDESLTQREKRTTAEVTRDKAIKQVESAKKALSDSALYAPFEGLVVKMTLEINEWVSGLSVEPEIIVVDPASVYFSAEVDQKDVGMVQVGQKAKVSFDAFSGKEFNGVVYQIAQITKEVDGGTVVEVKIKMDVPPSLIIGLDGDAEVVLEEKQDVVLVPKEAVYKKNGESFVRTNTGEKKITTGIFDGKDWEITSGLQEGEKIVW